MSLRSPQAAILDTFVPGFSLVSTALEQYFLFDVSIYLPIFMAVGLLVFSLRYVNEYFWSWIEDYFTCSADCRPDDETYNSKSSSMQSV